MFRNNNKKYLAAFIRKPLNSKTQKYTRKIQDVLYYWVVIFNKINILF